MNHSNSTTLNVRRFIPAPPARVFAAFTDANELQKWMGPASTQCRCTKAEVRVGGTYELKMRACHEGENSEMTVRGQYLEVLEPTRLVFTWGWEDDGTAPSQVTVDFIELEGGTDVQLRHERLASAESRDRHTQGWTGSIEKLARFVAPEPEPASATPPKAAGEFGWNELMTTNVPAAHSFYTQLFGWTSSKMPGGEVDYTIFSAGKEMAGGMMACVQPESPAYWLGYVMVSDCDASASRATELGGKICLPPKDIPNVGRIAIFTDPQGAALGLFQPSAR